MKRRSLLGFGAIGLLGIWALRPNDQGQPHAAYFAALNQLLRREGGGIPLLVIDLDRLDQNADLLAQRLGQKKLPVRLVAKSLASSGLLNYLANRLGTQRFMAFHQPQLNRLARDFPHADLLLGKPLPSAAALAFYQQMPASSTFVPARQLTWLIDSLQRLQQYAELARALKQPLQIALEIDIGLARGGFASPMQLGQALQWLSDNPAPLQVRGLVGYDAHVAHTPFWTSQNQAFGESNARYLAFLDSARSFTKLWPQQPLLNGGGSLSYRLHATGRSPINELAIGSALLKPSDFDTPLLSEHQPALWLASPVLKAQNGDLPFLGAAQPLLQSWNPNRQRAFYLYGGQWPADPVSPGGLDYDPLYGRSANQERLIGSKQTALLVDDWVFLRPQRAEGLFAEFDELRLLRRGRFVGSWLPHGRASGSY